jgi:hypothetical protein
VVLEFFTEYISEEDFYPVRDIKKIGMRYIKSSFVFDILTVIPFRYMVREAEVQNLLQLFKLLRLPRLFQLIEPKQFTGLIKSYYNSKIKRVIAKGAYKSEQLTDHNAIMRQIMIGYFFRVLRLVLIIFTISYFIGTLWFVYCWQLYTKVYGAVGTDNFIGEYKFDQRLEAGEDFDSMISVVYFAFTTLATVGYGDFHPVSNAELIFGSFIILFGVTVFSFIMGNFIEMLMEFKIVTAENEDNSNLSRWFGLLARFNKGRPLPKEMTFKIEEYFNYYW